MKIQDLLKKDLMILDLQATTKEAAIEEMVSRFVAKGIVSDMDTFKDGIMAREAQTSTGLGSAQVQRGSTLQPEQSAICRTSFPG